MALSSLGAIAQSACPAGYRVLSRRYDAELRTMWELRQDCAHPAWPACSVAIANSALLAGNSTSLPLAAVSTIPAAAPILVRAGEPVRLWSQDAASRIEIAGIAEQSAHLGEQINVRITHQTEDNGLAIQHIAGIVRAAANVEMAQ
ncbi:MAG TPA: flagella basal body P-ring formation protein FlgA [Acidobacteriaceae bacterium]